MLSRYFTILGLCSVILAVQLGCLPLGQRLLVFEIEQNGVVVLSGFRGVPDVTPVKRMWDVVGNVDFYKTVTKIPVEKLETFPLDGDVTIRIEHANDSLAVTLIEDLTLHSSDGGTTWSLDPEDVKRILQKTHD